MADEQVEEIEEEVEETVEEEPEESLRDSLEAAFDEASEPEEPTEETDTSEAEEVQEASGDEPEPIEYPSSWSEEIREKISQADPAFQKWAADFTSSQNSTFTRKMQELSRVQNNLNDVVQAIQPYEQSLKAAGETPGQRIGYLLDVDRNLFEGTPEQAKQTLLQLCQDAEINPQELVGGTGQPSSNGYSDPKVQALEAEVARLRQAAEEQTNFVQQQQQRAQQQEIESINGTIQAFATATGEDGKPLRPYFADVQEQLVPIVAGIKNAQPELKHEDVLAKAYDIAVANSPEIQEKIKAHQAKVEQAAVARQAKEKAAKAKKAGSSVKGSPGSTKPKKPENLRDTLEAAMSGQL